MNDYVEGMRGSRLKYWIGAVVTIIVLALGSLWLVSGLGSEQQLLPILPSPTVPTIVPQQEIETVSFSDLNDNPLAYLNQMILVTGNYLPSEAAACTSVVGPDIRWSLTADNLQLDALGFERIVRLLPAGTTMTVQGIWRLYQGPIGCGKGPARGSAWYLDTKRIIQPNPLVSEGSQLKAVEIINATLELPSIFPTAQGTNQAATAAGMTPTLIGDGTIEASATNPAPFIPTETPILPGGVLPTATTFQTPTVVGLTDTPESSPTGTTGTASVTPTPTENPGSGTPTFTPDSPPLPPTATSIIGYPGPGTTVPTLTPGPYP